MLIILMVYMKICSMLGSDVSDIIISIMMLRVEDTCMFNKNIHVKNLFAYLLNVIFAFIYNIFIILFM